MTRTLPALAACVLALFVGWVFLTRDPSSPSPPAGAAAPRVVEAAPQAPVVAANSKHSAALAAKDVTFDDVKLELKKGDPYSASLLTDKVKNLDDRAIRIRGYILPSFQQDGIKQFILVRDNMECCFGPGALLHDCIVVQMVSAATTSFTVRPVSVEGDFSIRELKDPDGKYLAIYHLDGKVVK